MEHLVKKTAVVSGLTLVSRILGMVRDAVIAMLFGGSVTADLFFLAFRPFDLLRKMFANGFLTLSFIPVFTRYLGKEGHGKALSLISSCLFVICLTGFSVIVLGIWLAPWLVGMLAPGAVDQSELAAVLLSLMLPYVWTIMGVSLGAAVLQCLGNFYLPALAPVVFNCVFIAVAVGAEHWPIPPVVGLALGVSLGGLAQVILIFPKLFKEKMLSWRGGSFNHPGMKETARKMLPAMIGSGAFHLNLVVASFFAGRLDPGSVSCLYYADRLVQFPMGLIAVSLSTVLLPTLAREAIEKKGRAGRERTFEQGVRLGIFITLPAMAGLMALNVPVVQLLFGRGAFDAAAVALTAECLFVLCCGLWAMTGIQLLSTLHFSLSRMKMPFHAGLISMGLNLAFCLLFMPLWGVQGLALSVALSSMGGCLYLAWGTSRGSTAASLGKPVLVSACRAVFLSVIMFFLVRRAAEFFSFDTGLGLAAQVLICIFLGAAFIFGAGWWTARSEVRLVTTLFNKG